MVKCLDPFDSAKFPAVNDGPDALNSKVKPSSDLGVFVETILHCD